MNKLSIPLEDTPVESIFMICANGFRDNEKKKKILGYCTDAVEASKAYIKYIPSDIASFPKDTVFEDDKAAVIDLYDKKFSSSQFPKGREFYNKIMLASSGKCAVCGVGQATTLDHYLPKIKHPLLCVFPANLIPECQDCNKNKGVYCVEKKEEMLIHPYFDDLSDIKWLEVELSFGLKMTYRYHNSYCDNNVISLRLSKTLEKYKLPDLYAVQANNLVENNKLFWKKTLETSGEKELIKYFDGMKESHECIDINSWSSALYRAIIKQSSEVISWIGSL